MANVPPGISIMGTPIGVSTSKISTIVVSCFAHPVRAHKIIQAYLKFLILIDEKAIQVWRVLDGRYVAQDLGAKGEKFTVLPGDILVVPEKAKEVYAVLQAWQRETGAALGGEP